MCDLEFEKVLFECQCEIDNKFWFFTNMGNHICSMSKGCDVIDYIDVNPYEEPEYNYLYAALIPYKQKIYLIPRAAKHIGIYDIEKKGFDKINLEEANGLMPITYDESFKFSSAVLVNDKIFLIPRKYPAIVEINLKSGEITYHKDWLKQYQKALLFDGDYFLYDYVVYEDKIYLPALSAGALIVIDSLRDSVTFFETKYESFYSGIEMYDSKLYISRANTGDIEIWDVKKMEYIDLIPIKCGNNHGSIAFGWLKRIENNIILIPFWHSDTLVMSEQGEVIQKYPTSRHENESQIAVCSQWFSDGRLYLLDNINKYISVYNENGQFIEKFSPYLPKEMWNCVLKKKMSISGLLYESETVSLSDFIDLVIEQ